MDGEPPFPTAELLQNWKRHSAAAMQRVEELDSIGINTAIDTYGLTNAEEFFAESCEAFFCNPNLLEEQFPELFQSLTTLFHIDPSPWFRNIRLE